MNLPKLIPINVPTTSFDYSINNVGCLRYKTMHGTVEQSSVVEPDKMGVYLEPKLHRLVGTITVVKELFVLYQEVEFENVQDVLTKLKEHDATAPIVPIYESTLEGSEDHLTIREKIALKIYKVRSKTDGGFGTHDIPSQMKMCFKQADDFLNYRTDAKKT